MCPLKLVTKMDLRHLPVSELPLVLVTFLRLSERIQRLLAQIRPTEIVYFRTSTPGLTAT
jgi:hypothetical protein